jgi:hypothetical protein
MKKRKPTLTYVGYPDVLLWKDHGGCTGDDCPFIASSQSKEVALREEK